jgi:hypothetical protein
MDIEITDECKLAKNSKYLRFTALGTQTDS